MSEVKFATLFVQLFLRISMFPLFVLASLFHYRHYENGYAFIIQANDGISTHRMFDVKKRDMEREDYFRQEEKKKAESLKRKSDCLGSENESQVEKGVRQTRADTSSDEAGDNGRHSNSKVVESSCEVVAEEEGSFWDRQRSEYEEHLRRCDDSPEIWDMKMTWDEWLMREKIDDAEFGSDEDIHSIRRACMDLPYHDREIEKEWKYHSNRFKEVRRRKQLKAT